jgi:hypothetical protein
VLISTALIYLSSEAVIFGYKFRNLPDYRRTLFRSPILYRYILSFLSIFGLSIILNAGYSFIISNIISA